jgi:prepilin-type N-terminal cleavage/methylation domain-containing protein
MNTDKVHQGFLFSIRVHLCPSRRRTRGVTLLEMMIVVAIIAVMTAVTYPSVASGIDSLRLNAACQSVVAFLNAGLNRAERRQQAMELTIAKSESALYLRSAEPGFERKLDLPEGITISKVLPEPPEPIENDPAPRVFLLYPGGTVPHIGVLLMNRRNVERLVQVDPMTGVPQVTKPTP